MSESIPVTERFFLFGNCNMVPDRYDDVSIPSTNCAIVSVGNFN